MKDKRRVFLIILVFCFSSLVFSQGKKKEKKLLPKSIGIVGSQDYTYRWLYDNPRFIDTTGPITDKDLIKYRNKYDRPRWGNTAGVIFERVLDEGTENYSLQWGIIATDMGEKLDKSKITEADFLNSLSEVPGGGKKHRYLAIELPLLLKFDISPKKGFFSYGGRAIFGMAGVSFGTPAIPLSSYGFSSLGNIMLRSIIGIGVSQKLSDRLKLSVAAVTRYSIVPTFSYERVNSYYYSLGAQVQFTYRLAKKGKATVKTVECKFVGNKKVKKKDNTLHGLMYGLNVAKVLGSDIKVAETGVMGIDGFPASIFTVSKNKIMMEWGTHIGLHTEKPIYKKKIAFIAEFMYSRKGFRTKYEYTLNDNDAINQFFTTANVRLNYFDMPLMVRYNFNKQLYAFGGVQATFALISKNVSTYYQFIDNSLGYPISYHFYDKTSSFRYFNDDRQRVFLYGFVGGIGVSLDERVDLNFRVQKTNKITEEKNYYNITGQVSLIYLFAKRW